MRVPRMLKVIFDLETKNRRSVIPAYAGIHVILLLAERDFVQRITWIPAYAGMTCAS